MFSLLLFYSFSRFFWVPSCLFCRYLPDVCMCQPLLDITMDTTGLDSPLRFLQSSLSLNCSVGCIQPNLQGEVLQNTGLNVSSLRQPSRGALLLLEQPHHPQHVPASLRAAPTSISSSRTVCTPGLLLGALISAPRVPELCSFDFDLGERSSHMGRVMATASETSPSVFLSALYLQLLLQEQLPLYHLLHSSASQRHTMCFVLGDAASASSSLCYGNSSASI